MSQNRFHSNSRHESTLPNQSFSATHTYYRESDYHCIFKCNQDLLNSVHFSLSTLPGRTQHPSAKDNRVNICKYIHVDVQIQTYLCSSKLLCSPLGTIKHEKELDVKSTNIKMNKLQMWKRDPCLAILCKIYTKKLELKQPSLFKGGLFHLVILL